MNINKILEQKNITKYKLSKLSGVPQTTVIDICAGKTKIEKCAADTLYKIAKVLDVTIETLIKDAVEYRPNFETFKSNIRHIIHDKGALDFIIDTLESREIRNLYEKSWFPESLYLLAMVDYLCAENNLPICTDYFDIRKFKLQEPVYPESILAMTLVSRDEKIKIDSYNHSIAEFKRFNIIESDVHNVL